MSNPSPSATAPATAGEATATAQQGARPVPAPSLLWSRWQALRGTNWQRVTVPAADLRNSWVLVTGGNSGIGAEAALQFASWGANVVLGCRARAPPHEPRPDVAVHACRAAADAAGHGGSTIEWWEVDMADLRSVEALALRWRATGRPLDVLANNAGMPGHRLGREAWYTADGFEIVHQVNFLAHVLLTLSLLPAVRLAAAPRIICTTSAMQYLGTFDPAGNANSGVNAYQNNKLYFQTWLTELQSRMLFHPEYRHVTIHGVHPGVVATNIWHAPEPNPPNPPNDSGGGGKAPTTGFDRRMGFVLRWFGIDAQQGSVAITYAATAEEYGADPETQGVGEGKGGGKYINRIWEQEPMPQTKDPECRRQIWEFVNQELKLNDKGLLDVLGI